jgi:hypothetical protein
LTSHASEARELPTWEAVVVRRYFGLQALNRFDRPGTVVVDPAGPVLCFFVQAGTSTAWSPLPIDGYLSITTKPPLPAESRPPSTYWLVPPVHGVIQLTDERTLRAALRELLPSWPEHERG